MSEICVIDPNARVGESEVGSTPFLDGLNSFLDKIRSTTDENFAWFFTGLTAAFGVALAPLHWFVNLLGVHREMASLWHRGHLCSGGMDLGRHWQQRQSVGGVVTNSHRGLTPAGSSVSVAREHEHGTNECSLVAHQGYPGQACKRPIPPSCRDATTSTQHEVQSSIVLLASGIRRHRIRVCLETRPGTDSQGHRRHISVRSRP